MESGLNESKNGCINAVSIPNELLEEVFPSALVFLIENIMVEVLKFSDFVLDLVSLHVNFIRISSNLLEIWTKDSVKLLDNGASLLDIAKYSLHVYWRSEDLSGLLEVPSLDSLFIFDVSFSLLELFLPFVKNVLTFLDDDDSLIRFPEDIGHVDLSLDHLTDFIGDAFKDIFHLELILVDMPGYCPDQLQTSQQ